MNMKQRLHMHSLHPQDPDYDGFEDWEEQIVKELDEELFSTGIVEYHTDVDGDPGEILLTEALDEIDAGDLLVDLFKAEKDKDKIVEAALNLRAEVREALEHRLEHAVTEELGYRIKQAEKVHG